MFFLTCKIKFVLLLTLKNYILSILLIYLLLIGGCMAAPRSSTLFHFTKSLQNILNILEKGFIPYYSLEDSGWLGSKLEFFACSMVCFCDIPISRIQDHVAFYGSYGIGMSKDWALKNGINPIAYYSEASPLSRVFNNAFRRSLHIKTEDPDSIIKYSFYSLLSYAKPITGTMIVDNNPVGKEFYLENEWRYVSDIDKKPRLIVRATFDDPDERTKLNVEAEANPIKFTPPDIRYIFVKTDADIPPVINFINDKLQSYTAVDLKILTSRVTSLEYLGKDI